ncbi:MAG TPA: ZIP family metal transporter [Thermoplasmata archaeon]
MADLLVIAFMVSAGLATALGWFPILVVQRLGHRTHDTLLGFAAGIMVAVAVLDILPKSAEPASGPWTGIALGIVAGVLTILVLVRLIRRIPLPMPFVRNSVHVNPGTAFLLFLALAIHNAPEGLATGLGYAEGLTRSGHAVAFAIALQNIPEGLLVSLAVFAETRRRGPALGYCVMSGIVEPVAGLLALLWVSAEPTAIGIASAFAVGAMASVVAFQMIPESHRHGHHVPATLALAAGFALVPLLEALIEAATR